jgi:threonine aldolase
MPTSPEASADAIRARCEHALSHHGPLRERPHRVLAELAETIAADLLPDRYGGGSWLAAFEEEVARLLGKEAAVFMPSGTMAQQIALRIWSDRAREKRVAFHPRCHLEAHEEKGYQMLHGLCAVLVGSPHALMRLSDVEKIVEPIAALLLELPQRDLGGVLPTWEQLGEIVAWARARGVALHLDGARLWETKPFYARSYAEIAAPFASVYVSFYKGLGGIAGCVLAGPKDFIAEARVWQRRHGGTLAQTYPLALAAREAMRIRLGRMDAYVAAAVSLAKRLSKVVDIEVVPEAPQTNMMHLFLRGDRERIEAAALAIADEKRIWLFSSLQRTSSPSTWLFELSIGDAALELGEDRVVAVLSELVDRARSP